MAVWQCWHLGSGIKADTTCRAYASRSIGRHAAVGLVDERVDARVDRRRLAHVQRRAERVQRVFAQRCLAVDQRGIAELGAESEEATVDVRPAEQLVVV